jgi:hypothetical protein
MMEELISVLIYWERTFAKCHNVSPVLWQEGREGRGKVMRDNEGDNER